MYLFDILFFALYRFEKANRYGYGMPYTQTCFYVALLFCLTLSGLEGSYSSYMYGKDGNIALVISRINFVYCFLFIFSFLYLFYVPYFKLYIEKDKDYRLKESKVKGCVLFWSIAIINLILLYYTNITQIEGQGIGRTQRDEPSEQRNEQNIVIDCEEKYKNTVAYGKCQIITDSVIIINSETFEESITRITTSFKQGTWKIVDKSVGSSMKDSLIVYQLSDSVDCKCKK